MSLGAIKQISTSSLRQETTHAVLSTVSVMEDLEFLILSRLSQHTEIKVFSRPRTNYLIERKWRELRANCWLRS
jgi:hypothetical protein